MPCNDRSELGTDVLDAKENSELHANNVPLPRN